MWYVKKQTYYNNAEQTHFLVICYLSIIKQFEGAGWLCSSFHCSGKIYSTGTSISPVRAPHSIKCPCFFSQFTDQIYFRICVSPANIQPIEYYMSDNTNKGKSFICGISKSRFKWLPRNITNWYWTTLLKKQPMQELSLQLSLHMIISINSSFKYLHILN